MSESGPLGAPPAIQVEVVREHPTTKQGFLWIRKVTLRNRYPDGHESASYDYFMVERVLLDAVALVLYRTTADGPEVVLRSQLRPPLAFRREYDVPFVAEGTGAVQWEIPAGLMELGERGEAGLFGRASAEALEEVGVRLAPERFALLGPAASLSPGLIAEKLHYVFAEIREDDERVEPQGDGHAVEEGSVARFVPLREALAAVDAGLVHDVKTEIGLHRIARRLGVSG